MTTCHHCGNPIVAGERIVTHMDDEPTWIHKPGDEYATLVTPQPMSYTPYHLHCFQVAHPAVDLDPTKFVEFRTTIMAAPPEVEREEAG